MPKASIYGGAGIADVTRWLDDLQAFVFSIVSARARECAHIIYWRDLMVPYCVFVASVKQRLPQFTCTSR